MVPSQTRIVMAGLTADRLIAGRSSFWEKIYGAKPPRCGVCSGSALILLRIGFDLSPMKVEKDEEGVVEDVLASELCTSECIIKVGRIFGAERDWS